MKKTIFTFFIFVFAFGMLGMRGAASNTTDRAEGTILVKFKDNVSRTAAKAALARHGGRVADTIDALSVLKVRLPKGQEDKVLALLAQNPNVEYAEPDYFATALVIPNDPFFAEKQWGLENTGQVIVGRIGTVDADIDASTAWDTTMGPGIRVAILDTGIDQDHEDIDTNAGDLLGKIVAQQNFTTSSTIDDLYGHGTHVGGIVAALTNNGLGVAGGCGGCVLMNGKVLGDNGSGAYSWVANGVVWAADNGAKVINLSLGGTAPSRTLESAINYAWNKGVVIVAAAGNSGSRSKLYPAAYKNVIAVAATNNNDQKASFSNYGVKWVDVAAPGENIFSTFPNHPFAIQTNYGRSQNYDFGSGTSMAAPMVAAASALVWSTPYGTSASSVRTRLESTADTIPGTGTYWSKGRINAATAVATP